mmetsp:Transcript_42860/g.48699  ORF Transcript_42860/g.48699 Transcript_42860/m.48699 type:complete len:561 (-) Transcript_42860:190-1872(-)
MTSPESPPGYPSRAVTRTKEKNNRSFPPPRFEQKGRKVLAIRRGRKHRDDVRDGKFFHVRVSLGYLTSLRNLKIDDSIPSNGSNIISVFASFSPDAGKQGEYNFATSLPLKPNVERQTAKWPKGTDVVTSKRRLYHSVILRTDDLETEENKGSTFDDDDSTSMLSPAPYAPAFVNIYVGLKRGEEIVSIGVATLVVSGRPVRSQKMDLPVKNLALPRSKADDLSAVRKKKSSGLKSFFNVGSMKKQDPQKKKEDESLFEATLARLSDGRKRYAFEKTAVLQIKLDTIESVHQSNGPGLWGDLEDDEESFGPIPVIDIPEDYTADLTNRYQHETIEVMQFKQGATIISSPGHGEVEENSGKDDSDSREKILVPREGSEIYVGVSKVGSKLLKRRGIPNVPPVSSADDPSYSSANISRIESRTLHDDVSGIYTSEYGSYVSHDEEATTGTKEGDRDYAEAAKASNTLMRYASRIGVAVEDLLDAAPDSLSQNLSSCGSSTRNYESNATYPHGLSKSGELTTVGDLTTGELTANSYPGGGMEGYSSYGDSDSSHSRGESTSPG